MEYLFKKAILPDDVTEIAKFLEDSDGLSRQALGEYFGRLSDPRAVNVSK